MGLQVLLSVLFGAFPCLLGGAECPEVVLSVLSLTGCRSQHELSNRQPSERAVARRAGLEAP